MEDWEAMDLFDLWEQLSEQTTSAGAGGYAVPFPGPLRAPNLSGEPSPALEAPSYGAASSSYEDASEFLKKHSK